MHMHYYYIVSTYQTVILNIEMKYLKIYVHNTIPRSHATVTKTVIDQVRPINALASV